MVLIHAFVRHASSGCTCVLRSRCVDFTGWLDEATEGQWGIVDIDWENSRRLWAGNLSRAPGPARPMCERNMITQVEKLKAARPNVKAWVYRNIVKADNWFESVQKVLDDPQYAGWFVRFDAARLANNSTTSPPCDSNYDPPKCSPFYHDQTLVPNVPDPHSGDPARRRPAGACVGACDCGKHPCGEYGTGATCSKRVYGPAVASILIMRAQSTLQVHQLWQQFC